MHIPTHILSGWCLGNWVNLKPRERLLCMAAASIPDIDGCGIVFGQEMYWRFHHFVGHNIFFGLMIAGLGAVISTRRWLAFAIYLLAFHLHLLMDFFGSGPGWKIHYWWPLSERGYRTQYVWDLSSWQNTTAAVILLVWTIAIAYRFRRTPLELISPSLDRRLTGSQPTVSLSDE